MLHTKKRSSLYKMIGGSCVNDNYKVEDLPLHIKPEVREKCNN